jgi:hypothetical protein
MVLIGAGLGFASTSYMLTIQSAVPWNLRGVATSSTQFFRTISGSIGVAIMGTILNAQLAERIVPIFARLSDETSQLPGKIYQDNMLLTPNMRIKLPANFLL